MDLIWTLTTSLSIQAQIDSIGFNYGDQADNKSSLFSFIHALTLTFMMSHILFLFIYVIYLFYVLDKILKNFKQNVMGYKT